MGIYLSTFAWASKKELEKFDIIRMYNLETLNKDIKNKEHKYYLIADIYFQYAGFKAITKPQLKNMRNCYWKNGGIRFRRTDI